MTKVVPAEIPEMVHWISPCFRPPGCLKTANGSGFLPTRSGFDMMTLIHASTCIDICINMYKLVLSKMEVQQHQKLQRLSEACELVLSGCFPDGILMRKLMSHRGLRLRSVSAGLG